MPGGWVVRYFEDHPFTEMPYSEAPDGALVRITRLRNTPSCWFRNGPQARKIVHPDRPVQVASDG